MALQEHLASRLDEIMKEIDEWLGDETKAKEKLDRENGDFVFVKREIFARWLDGYTIANPSDYFLEQDISGLELESNIMSPQEFMLNTLEFFGLPKDYIDGNGHFADWEKRKEEQKGAKKKPKKKTQKLSAAA